MTNATRFADEAGDEPGRRRRCTATLLKPAHYVVRVTTAPLSVSAPFCFRVAVVFADDDNNNA
jgi:hypothetical protein